MNFVKAESQITEIKKWFLHMVMKSANYYGGASNLSGLLGKEKSYILSTVRRGAFSSLYRIVKKLKEKNLLLEDDENGES